MRYIANLKYADWHGRKYLQWTGDASVGDEAFRNAMHRVEIGIGPSSKTLDDFKHAADKLFLDAGFQEFAP